MQPVEQTGYMSLRGAIVRGALAPNARLVEGELCETFGMSRGSVRTALVRLEQEGLVVRERHRGARVRAISDDEAVEIVEVRAALESFAAGRAAERIDDVGAARLKGLLNHHGSLIAVGDLLAASEANAALHAALLELSGQTTIQRLLQTLNAHIVRHQFRTILIPGRPAASHEEHEAIVAAVVAAEPAAAERLMRAHILKVAELLRISTPG